MTPCPECIIIGHRCWRCSVEYHREQRLRLKLLRQVMEERGDAMATARQSSLGWRKKPTE